MKVSRHVVERARIQIEHWDKDGCPELEYRRERLETMVNILRALVDGTGAA